MRAGQGTKQRNGAAGRPIASRLDVDQVDRQRVSRLGALDIEGPGLRIDEGVLDRLAGQVLLGADPAGEAILCIEIEDIARLHPGDRVDATEGPGVLLLGGNDPLDVDGLDGHSPYDTAPAVAHRGANTWRFQPLVDARVRARSYGPVRATSPIHGGAKSHSPLIGANWLAI